jgi:hypothetical protein
MSKLLSQETPTPLPELQRDFLGLLPQISAVARFGFRHLACPEQKADALAGCIALAWKWVVRLDQLGQRDRVFPTALAGYAVKQVRSGRGVGGQARPKDVLNRAAQRRFGFSVRSLPSLRRRLAEAYRRPTGQRHLDGLEEQLQHNTITPVPEQVQFRIDWPAWLATLSKRDRQLIRRMSQGERTGDLARHFQLSPARISQKRQEFQRGWNAFAAT